MPELHKKYPVITRDWAEATPNDQRDWLNHIANEYLWSQDDAAYAYMTTLSAILASEGWVYDSKNSKAAAEKVALPDDVAIDIRKFSVQKAREILDFNYIEDEADELVESAKIIEAYILGTD